MRSGMAMQGFGLFLLAALAAAGPASATETRPNILLAISDDQSFRHTSFAGYPGVKTPHFDRVAREGIYFSQAFSASPGCSPSRAALLTGRNCWQLEHAGTHASSFPARYHSYPDILETAGYAVGFTGKGWAPGDFEVSGRTRNPAGPEWNDVRTKVPVGMSSKDYAANFAAFLESREPDQPFAFWFGGHEPHRAFKPGLGREQGKVLADGTPPPFLPDTPEVRDDMLDYCAEIEWFDQHLGRMLALLEAKGELDNTIVVVTSDNGMAFPRAKANMYEYGIHMPLAIRWGKAAGGRRVDTLVSLVDLAPTFLAAAGVAHPGIEGDAVAMRGISLLDVLTQSEVPGAIAARDAVFSARERHSSSRYESRGYPQRGMRTQQYLYVRNFHPDYWPAGAPQKFGEGSNPVDTAELGPMHGAYHDIDACPTFDFMRDHREDPAFARYFRWAVDKRPAVELYDIVADPACLNNLATDPAHAETAKRLGTQMDAYLRETGDPRMVGDGEIFETYPRYSKHRTFPKPE